MQSAETRAGTRENENRTLILVGAGGHGRVVAEAAAAAGWTPLFCDPTRAPGERVDGVEVIARQEEEALARCPGAAFVLALGARTIRRRLALKLETLGARIATIVHPSAVVSPTAAIAPGTAILPGAIVNAGARVGAHAIVNSAAVVEHDCVLGRGVHVSPGATLAGAVRIGDWVEIGANATVLPGRVICAEAQIGAGAVVTRDIAAPGVYVGAPARRR